MVIFDIFKHFGGIFGVFRQFLAIFEKSHLVTLIKESYTKRFRKTEKMSRISYIASSGGLLGLCMGFSFVSLAEIAYHCFLCMVLLFRKKRALFKKAQAQKAKMACPIHQLQEATNNTAAGKLYVRSL